MGGMNALIELIHSQKFKVINIFDLACIFFFSQPRFKGDEEKRVGKKRK